MAYENAPILIEQISKFFEQNSGNKNSKVLCIFENEYLKHINLKQYENIIYKSITEFSPDAFADCINIDDWSQILQNIVLNKTIWQQIFSVKNENLLGKKRIIITILGIKIKVKIASKPAVTERIISPYDYKLKFLIFVFFYKNLQCVSVLFMLYFIRKGEL